jgi:hypothetical protein
MEELTRRISCLAMSESTQASPMVKFYLDSETKSALETNPGSFHEKPGSFPMGIRNTASTLQEINWSLFQGSFRKLGRLPTGLDNMARTYQDML